MNKEFIPYTEALALKALGYDEPCFGWFSKEHDYKFIFGSPEYSKIFIKNGCLASPTFSQAFRWFRENYNLFGHIEAENNNSFYWHIRNPEQFISSQTSDTYEEAELACLRKLIEIVEQKIKD